MSDAPWLTIVGLGEDGPDGLSSASRDALAAAEIVMGPPRHLGLLPGLAAKKVEWPVPFADGIQMLLRFRGQRVVVLASGDPFWFGAGTVLAKHLATDEWRALPGVSVFSLAANRLGWALETTTCLGLHAAPLTRLRPHLAPGRRIIATLRDPGHVEELNRYLQTEGFGASKVTVLEALGGPNERIGQNGPWRAPLCVAIDAHGGAAMPVASGIADDWFDTTGQITKRPIRALTLSALAPKPFEHLWDIGGGSGSICIEWLLTDRTTRATTIEPRDDRAQLIKANALRLGVDRLNVVTGSAPEALAGLPEPDAVFIGGGLSATLMDWLMTHLPIGTRIVANAVTLETETLLINAHDTFGGDLMRISLSNTVPLGAKRGWRTHYPIVQWSFLK